MADRIIGAFHRLNAGGLCRAGRSTAGSQGPAKNISVTEFLHCARNDMIHSGMTSSIRSSNLPGCHGFFLFSLSDVSRSPGRVEESQRRCKLCDFTPHEHVSFCLWQLGKQQVVRFRLRTSLQASAPFLYARRSPRSFSARTANAENSAVGVRSAKGKTFHFSPFTFLRSFTLCRRPPSQKPARNGSPSSTISPSTT